MSGTRTNTVRTVAALATVFVVAALGLVFGCAERAAAPPPASYAQESWFEDGPLELHAAIDEIETDVVGTIHLRFDATIEAGYTLVTPEIGGELGVFEVVDIRRSGPTMRKDGRVAWSLDLAVEPYLPGEHEIPALDFAYSPVADGGSGRDARGGVGGIITTRPITVTVASVLDGEELSLGELRDVIDPENDIPFPVGGVVIAGVIALGLLGTIVVIARKLQLEPLPPSPVTEALQRLQVLELRPHDEPHERAATLSEVSELIRRCIAHRAEPKAARMSERELRRSMANWPGLDTHEHIRLSALFKRLDEARFSGHEPGKQETRDIVREAIELLPAIERAFVHFSIASAAEEISFEETRGT